MTSAYIRYNPSPEDQKRASLQGMSGLFIVEYDVERTTNVGEVMVRFGQVKSNKIEINTINLDFCCQRNRNKPNPIWIIRINLLEMNQIKYRL